MSSTIRTESRAEAEARIAYKYKPKANTALATVVVHLWTSPSQYRSFCGRMRRDDPKLVDVPAAVVPKLLGRLCRRCTWYKPDLEKRLATQQGA